MRILVLVFLVLLKNVSATYIFFCDEKDLDQEKKSQLFELFLQNEPPRSFYSKHSIDLKIECCKIVPSIRIEWIPPSLWQIAMLHSFFFNQSIKEDILACVGDGWNPISYEEVVHRSLSSVSSVEEIAKSFDSHSKCLPNVCELFFKVNNAVRELYKRANGNDLDLLHIVISEIPCYEQWFEKDFPFWKSPWVCNPNSAKIFYLSLKDEKMISEILTVERHAFDNGEWVLYRGYDGRGYPSTLQKEDDSSHALSFGSTLLGGAFFSLEASALAYCKTSSSEDHSFFALRVTPEELKEIFRIGLLHPFIQMVADGEMFHAHTKVAAKNTDEYTEKLLRGYFMKCNKHCFDPINYIVTLKMTSEELERVFSSICQRSGFFLIKP